MFAIVQALGKTGKVLKVYSDGDLRVAVGGEDLDLQSGSAHTGANIGDLNIIL